MVRREKPKHTSQSTQLDDVLSRLRYERIYQRYPLFVLGSGISSEVVPFLYQLAAWFAAQLEPYENVKKYSWLLGHAKLLSTRMARRRDAAEFFSAMQGPDNELSKIWQRFSYGFLLGGLPLGKDARFPGLCSESVKPTSGHRNVAMLVRSGLAFAVSLNFDGLTHMALTEDGKQGQVLHSSSDVEMYFTADTPVQVPAIIKVRGDVFYAQCKNRSCHLSSAPYPIDRIRWTDKTRLECPNCHSPDLRLQFQFPGYREKEEIAHPMLWATRAFIGHRISSIIIIGLSGQWDRYMLQFLFDLARERNLLVVDVKPPSDPELINEFRSIYYPSIVSMANDKAGAAAYARLTMGANYFLGKLLESIPGQNLAFRSSRAGVL